MDNLKKLLFKKTQPVLRKFEPMTDDGAGDIPYLWDAYKKGLLKQAPENMNMDEFVEFMLELLDKVQEVWVVEDFINKVMQPIGVVFCAFDGWQMEPHVFYFDNATPRTILRTYVAFLKKTRRRKDVGSCFIRVPQETIGLTNRIEKMKLIQWVGKVWGGKPDGNEYLYSMRCAAKKSYG